MNLGSSHILMITAVDTQTKDWIQVISWIGALIGIAIAVLKYVSEQKQNRRQQELQLDQRKLELRWKQAEAAKKMLDEMLTDQGAQAAMTMLDWDDLEFEIKPGVKANIWEKDYVSALRTKDLDFSDKEAYIRSCFDNLFYYMAMMDHYINSGLVLLEDVVFPLDYYLAIMNRNRNAFHAFLEHYGQTRTLNFLASLEMENQLKKRSTT
jgi:hypothetical protein